MGCQHQPWYPSSSKPQVEPTADANNPLQGPACPSWRVFQDLGSQCFSQPGPEQVIFHSRDQ